MADDQLAPGQDEENKLRAGGFSDDDISTWKTDTTQKLQKGGFSDQDVKDYFGVKEPDTSAMKDYVKKNIQAHLDEKKAREPIDTAVKPVQGTDFMDALAASWQNSTLGLMMGGRKPDILAPQDQGFLADTLSQVPKLLGDAPAMAVGGVATGALATAVGGPVATPFGTMAGAFAAPAAMRKILMDHYEKGDITDAHDFMTRLTGTTWEALKQAGVGIATAATGGFAGPVAEGIAGPAMGKIAQLGAESVAMTAAGAGVEGHLPSMRDFGQAALLIGGMHAVAGVTPKLMEIYKQTGESPGEIATAAATDVNLKQDLMRADPDTPEIPQHPDLKGEETPPAETEAPPKPQEEMTDEEKAKEPTPLSEDEKTMLSKIGESPEAPGKSLRDMYKQGRINNIDAYEEFKNIGASDTYQRARVFNAVQDRVMSFVNEGPRDFETGERVKGTESYTKILSDNETENKDPGSQRLVAYWMAKRGLELDSRGIESLFPKAEDKTAAERLVQDGEAKYQPFVDKMVKSKNAAVDYFADSGFLNDAQVEKMKELNQSHLPLHTVQEIDPLTGAQGSPVAKGIKKIEGSLDLKTDPLTAIYKDTEMLITMADANAVRKSLFKELGDESFNYLREVKPGMEKVDISPEQLAGQMGIDAESAGAGLTVFRPEKVALGENQVAVWNDGKRTVYEGNPDVIDAMKRLDGDYVAMPVWGKLMRGFSTSLRIGTVSNPAFAIRHFIRSQYSAGIYSQTGMIPFIDPMLSLKDLFTNKDLVKQWIYDGGAVNTFGKIDNDFVKDTVFEGKKNEDGTYDFVKPKWMDKAWSALDPRNGAQAFAHANEAFIKLTDNMARYTEYKRALEQGASRDQAAFMGRNVTADYQRAGAVRSALRSSVAFMNVHIQVTDRALSEATNPDTRLGFAAKVLAGVTLPNVLLWAATNDDDRIKDLPRWQRNMYMNFPIDNWREAKDPAEYTVMPDSLRRMEGQKYMVNDGPVIKIPVAGEPGIVFGTAIQAGLESLKRQDAGPVKDAARQILESTLVMPIPNALTAPIEQYTNKNFFTGRSVVSPQKEKELPYQQYDQYTSETAKQIGKLIGYVPLVRDIGPKNNTLQSPMVVDNYIKDWTGGGGAYAVQLIDKALNMSGVGSVKVQPDKDLSEQPFFKEFLIHYPNAKLQPIEDFHDRYEKASSILATVKDQQRQGDLSGASETINQYGPEMDRVKEISNAMKMQNLLIKGVMADTTMTPSDKKQLLTTTYYQMLMSAKLGNQIMDTFARNVKDTKEVSK